MANLERYIELRLALKNFRALKNPLAILEEARRLEREALAEGLSYSQDAHGQWKLVPFTLAEWLYSYTSDREENLTRIGMAQQEIAGLLVQMKECAGQQAIVVRREGA